jgi:hypothetical protein
MELERKRKKTETLRKCMPTDTNFCESTGRSSFNSKKNEIGLKV